MKWLQFGNKKYYYKKVLYVVIYIVNRTLLAVSNYAYKTRIIATIKMLNILFSENFLCNIFSYNRINYSDVNKIKTMIILK